MNTYKIEHYIVSLAVALKELQDYGHGGDNRWHILDAAKVVEKELHERFAVDNDGIDMPTGELMALIWREKGLE